MCEIIQLFRKNITPCRRGNKDRRASFLPLYKKAVADIEGRKSVEISAATFEHLVGLFVANNWMIQVKHVLFHQGRAMIYVMWLTEEQRQAIEWKV